MIRGRLRRALKARLERLERRRDKKAAELWKTNETVGAIERLLATQRKGR